MRSDRFTCGIVIPVRNEAEILSKTVPALLASVEGERPRIVWVCNGCSDGSAEVIRRLIADLGDVIEIATPGKTLALQAGDELLDAEFIFPRIYLDADTWLRPGDVQRLLQPLRSGAADLVAASHAFDTSQASFVSAQIAHCWLSLPFARSAAYLGAVAVSSSGRAHWGSWPKVLADDGFMMRIIPFEKRVMVAGAIATTWPPSSFVGWISMRARWLRGERQLDKLGLSLMAAPGQRISLLKRIADPRAAFGALAFCAVRLLAIPLSKLSTLVYWDPKRWANDRG